MEKERINLMETDMDSPKMERKERGKFLSLNKQEAKLVLETYIQRSFSNRETKRTVEKKIQRSVSDLTKFRRRAKEKKMPIPSKAELLKTEKRDVDHLKKPLESEETVQQKYLPTSTANIKPAKKSWFKTLLDHLFKKDDTPSESPVVSSVSPDTEGNLTHTSKKANIKKNSFRKALSFKKSASEDTKLKRPTYLPLKSNNRLSSCKLREKHGDCYYQEMSAEIELLVNDSDCRRKPSLGEESFGGETQDDVIKQIVSILQKEGDAYDRKIKEDPTLCDFFRNISYNSFKQLADVYIGKEMKTRRSHDTPEDMKFAFSIHFTKQVAGIATHPVNRIMGFGNQYLQDNFTWLSHNRDNMNSDLDPEGCISPD